MLANHPNLLGRGAKIPAGGANPIGGTIAATQVAYGSAANTIKGDAAYTFTEGTGVLKIGVTGSSANSVSITGSSAGALSLTAAGTNQNVTLTPSGTGQGILATAYNGLVANFASGALSVTNTNNTTGLSIGTFASTGANADSMIAFGNGAQFIPSIQASKALSNAAAALSINPNGGNVLINGVVNGPGALQFPNHATNAGGIALGTGLFLWAATSGGSGLGITGKISSYNGISTSGWGVSTVQADGNITAATNARSAAVAAYTVGAADGTFVVSGAINVTTSTAFTFSLDCVYTDDGNVSRTLVLPIAQLAGTFVASGLATNVTGAGPYESASMTIRCKASTSITLRPSAGGTYTTVVYNVAGNIRQIG